MKTETYAYDKVSVVAAILQIISDTDIGELVKDDGK